MAARYLVITLLFIAAVLGSALVRSGDTPASPGPFTPVVPEEALRALEQGRYWRASRILGEYLAAVPDPEPASILLAAQANAGWGDWAGVERLLSGRGWLDTVAGGFGWNLLGRYSGLYVSRGVGDAMKLGLGRLSSMLASVPNVDYDVQGSTLANLRVVERPAENLLLVGAGAIERRTAEIQASMESNMEWINRTMAANDLEPAGPMRIITTELGREVYNFDVVQPVRTEGSGPDESGNGNDGETADNGNGDDNGDEAAAAPVLVDEGELEDLELLGPVEYVRTEPTLTAGGDYTGFMAELETVRNAIRAWAMTQGHEVTGRPYEIYKSGIEDSFTADGEYEVYWTLQR